MSGSDIYAFDLTVSIQLKDMMTRSFVSGTPSFGRTTQRTSLQMVSTALVRPTKVINKVHRLT